MRLGLLRRMGSGLGLLLLLLLTSGGLGCWWWWWVSSCVGMQTLLLLLLLPLGPGIALSVPWWRGWVVMMSE